MATKPTGADTVPDWPSNANFTVGPSTGQPTTIDPTPFAANGHIEGVSNPTDCRVQNGWQKRVGKWSRWVESGSSAGASDAHIVETDADGKAKVAALEVLGNSGLAGPSLQVYRGDTGSPAASFYIPLQTTVELADGNHGMSITSAGIDGARMNVTGDAMPLTLSPVSSHPATLTNKDGSFYTTKFTLSGDDSVVPWYVSQGGRHSIPAYNAQFVRELYTADLTSINSNSDVSVIPPFTWTQRKSPQSTGIPLEWRLYFEAVGPAGAQFQVKVKNNGAVIGDPLAIFVATGGADRFVMEDVYYGGTTGISDNYEVTMNRVPTHPTVSVSRVKFTIQTQS